MLVNCVAYEDGRRLADIELREIHSYLARPRCFVWVALKDATETELEQMREEFDLHPLAVEDARHGHQRPKIEEYGDSLFLVLQMIEMDASGGLKLGELDLFVGPNYVLSVRSRTQEGFAGVRARCEREPHLLFLAQDDSPGGLDQALERRLRGCRFELCFQKHGPIVQGQGL